MEKSIYRFDVRKNDKFLLLLDSGLASLRAPLSALKKNLRVCTLLLCARTLTFAIKLPNFKTASSIWPSHIPQLDKYSVLRQTITL